MLVEGDNHHAWAAALREFPADVFDPQHLPTLAEDAAPNVFHERIAGELESLRSRP